MGLFSFLEDEGTHNQRKVARFEQGESIIIDTCEVSDGTDPYETAVMHPEYNDGKWIIVQSYRTREDARRGHDDWVRTMTSRVLPKSLKDCGNAGITELLEMVGGQMEFVRGESSKQ